MTTKERKNATEVIKKLARQLDDIFTCHIRGHYYREVFELSLEGEKRHRKCKPADFSYAGLLSTRNAALYFTAKYILEGVLDPEKWGTWAADSIIGTRTEYVLGHALGAAYADKILEHLEIDETISALLELDYVELVNP